MNALKIMILGAALTALTTVASAQTTITNGLVAYYPLNGNANDASGNGNHGISTNVASGTDRFYSLNGCGVFNGSDSSIDIPSLATFQYAPVTYSAWISINDLMVVSNIFLNQVSVIVGRDRGCDGSEGALSLYTERSKHLTNVIAYYTGNDVVPSNQNPLSEWSHLILTIDVTNRATLFRNGVQVASKQLASFSASQFPFKIGESATTLCPPGPNSRRNWSGAIDDVRIYNRALTSSEVAQLYFDEAPPILNIRKAVYLDSPNLKVGSNYQIQASSDLNTWTNFSSPFTATNSIWRTTNYWDIDNWDQLFFRLQLAP